MSSIPIAARQTRCIFLACTCIALNVLAGCQQSASSSDAQSTDTTSGYRIVTTTGMITDLTRQIAAEHANVTGLIGTGIDPHLYAPTRTDIRSIMTADVLLYSGLLLEGKMTDAFERVAESGTPTRAVTEHIDESFLLTPPEFLGHPDPHVWMDPAAWTKAAEVIADTLIEHDPSAADSYTQNTEGLIDNINLLDQYAERVLSTVPESQRVLVTAHDAFNYFGRRYGYEVVGIQGISTESEAGVRDIERIVDLLVERQIKAVFVETTVSERNIRALIAGAKARGHTVVIGGNLFSDAMGEAGTYEGTYIGMIDHNVTTIARALGGIAPEKGMSGKLGGHKEGSP